MQRVEKVIKGTNNNVSIGDDGSLTGRRILCAQPYRSCTSIGRRPLRARSARLFANNLGAGGAHAERDRCYYHRIEDRGRNERDLFWSSGSVRAHAPSGTDVEGPVASAGLAEVRVVRGDRRGKDMHDL